MSLRTRLLVGLGIIAGLLVVSGLLILGIQRAFLVGQLDDRMNRQVQNATAQVAAGEELPIPGPGQQRQSRGLAEVYLGVLTATGLETLNTPVTDPGLTPTLDPADPPPSPATVPATGGEAESMRIITSELSDDRSLVLGRSMGEVDTALTGLRTTLLLVGSVLLAVIALVFWWMHRLGIDPILRVTRVARSISAGDTSQRVEPFPAGTEAHDLGTAFNQLVDTSEATQERLRQFVADASHELRTPLVTLKGYAALYGAGGLPDEQGTADAMRRIKQEADRMGRLVDDLLLLAELDRGPTLSLGPVDLVGILEDLAGDLRAVDPDRVITVHAPGSAVVQGDRDRLIQVVAALTNNALRHTPTGTAIDLRIVSSAASVRIEVADHGPGIAAEDLAKVFDRFYRGDVARARASGGSGLGPGNRLRDRGGPRRHRGGPEPSRRGGDLLGGAARRRAADAVGRAHRRMTSSRPCTGTGAGPAVSVGVGRAPGQRVRSGVGDRSTVALEGGQVPLAAGQQVAQHGRDVGGGLQLQGLLEVGDVGDLDLDADLRGLLPNSSRPGRRGRRRAPAGCRPRTPRAPLPSVGSATS